MFYDTSEKMVYGSNGYKACSQTFSYCADCCIKVFPGVLPPAKHIWQNGHICPWQNKFPRGYTPGTSESCNQLTPCTDTLILKLIFFPSQLYFIYFISRLHLSQGLYPWQIIKISKFLVSTFPGVNPWQMTFPSQGYVTPVKKPLATDHISCSASVCFALTTNNEAILEAFF
jgi:hypothetical protein